MFDNDIIQLLLAFALGGAGTYITLTIKARLSVKPKIEVSFVEPQPEEKPASAHTYIVKVGNDEVYPFDSLEGAKEKRRQLRLEGKKAHLWVNGQDRH